MKNNFPRQIQAKINQAREQGFFVGLQMAADAHALALNDLYHVGPSRYPEFHARTEQYVHEMCQMIHDDTDDLEYSKTVIDRRLIEIVGQDNFLPYDQRYDYGV